MKRHPWREVTSARGNFIPQDLSHGAAPLPGGACSPTGQPGSRIPLEVSQQAPSASSPGNQILLSTSKCINPPSPSPLGTWPLPCAWHTLKHQAFLYVPRYSCVEHDPTRALSPFALPPLPSLSYSLPARTDVLSCFPNASYNRRVNVCPMTGRTGM